MTRDEADKQAKAYVRERYPFDEDTQQFQDMVDRERGQILGEQQPDRENHHE